MVSDAWNQESTFSVTSPSDSSRQELQAPRRLHLVEPHHRRAGARHPAPARHRLRAPSAFKISHRVRSKFRQTKRLCSPLESRRVLSPPSAQSFPRARRNYTPAAHVLRGRHRIDRPQETLLRARATYLTHSSSL